MNQHEQLKRMRALQKDAVRLKDAIKDEINEILDDIAERRKFADECDERATKANRTWDGKQPDFWYEAGHIWRKATDSHRGQSVLVAKDRQGMRPLDCFESERIAKLGKVTEFGDYACYNSDETKINHWPIAWAPCTQDEVDQYRGGKFVSVVLADKMKLVNEAAKDQTEQADPLLDDPLDPVFDAEDIGNPSETPNSSKPTEWIPKVGDKVRVVGLGLYGEIEYANGIGGHCWLVLCQDGYFRWLSIKGMELIEAAKEPEYREPSHCDIEKKVEVRNYENHEWVEFVLICVLHPGGYRFCVEDGSGHRSIWKYARIKADC